MIVLQSHLYHAPLTPPPPTTPFSQTLECARTNLEYMGDTAAKSFSLGATSSGVRPGEGEHTPFSFRADRSRVRATASLDHVTASIAAGRPCIVVASFASLAFGLARTLFLQIAADSKNAVFFTSRATIPDDSVASQLLPTGSAVASNSFTFSTTTIVPLAGAELAAWKEARLEEKQRVVRAAAAARARAREADELAAATAAANVTAEAAPAAAVVEAADAPTDSATAMKVDATLASMYLDDDNDAILSIEDVDDALKGFMESAAVAGSLRALAWRSGGPTSRFPLFARDTKQDAHFAQTEYGLQVDPADFMDTEVPDARSSPSSSGPASAAVGSSAPAHSHPHQVEPLASKRVRNTLTMRVQCRIAMHALEGCAVGESLVHVLEATAPLRLVVLAGCASSGAAAVDAARALAQAAIEARLLPKESVMVLDSSAQGEEIDISSQVSELKLRVLNAAVASTIGAFPLALAPPLLRVGDTHSVAYVKTRILALASSEGASEAPELFLASDVNDGNDDPMAVANAEDEAGHLPLILRAGGPLRLPELRRQLRAVGIVAEVIDGALITRGGIIVKRLGTSEEKSALNVEGPPIPEFFQVKQIVAQAHAFF